MQPASRKSSSSSPESSSSSFSLGSVMLMERAFIDSRSLIDQTPTPSPMQPAAGPSLINTYETHEKRNPKPIIRNPKPPAISHFCSEDSNSVHILLIETLFQPIRARYQRGQPRAYPAWLWKVGWVLVVCWANCMSATSAASSFALLRNWPSYQ
jgi:hypothetical protein